MEAFAEELFLSLKFTLPYLCDRTNSSHEAKGQTVVGHALQHINSHIDQLFNGELDYAIMILAINLQTHPWNNGKLVKEAVQMYEQLQCNASNKHFISTFFGENPKFCTKVVRLITSTLKRDSWQDRATSYVLYKWFCLHLAFPLVSDHLDVLLPPSLLLMDGYDDELKVSGVECLSHIMSECGKTELRWHGRAQVIFEAFQKLSYAHHPPLVSVLHPALIKILQIIENDPSAVTTERKVDGVFQQLLTDMYVEDRLLLRRTYALCLKLYVDYLNTHIIKHLKLTMKVVLSYMEDSCGSAELTRSTVLEVIQLLVKQGRPRIQNYYVDITKSLIRLVVDAVMLPANVDSRKDIVSRVSQIFKMMDLDDCPFILQSLNMIVSNLPVEEDKNGSLLLECIQQIKSAQMLT